MKIAAAVFLLAMSAGCGAAGAALDVANDDCPAAEVWIKADGRDVWSGAMLNGDRHVVTDTGITNGASLQINIHAVDQWKAWTLEADARPVIALSFGCDGSVHMQHN